MNKALWDSDTPLKWCVCVGYTYRILTFVGHVSMECPIQKIFVGFLTILARFQHVSGREKRPRELLRSFVFLLLIGWSIYASTSTSRLPATPLSFGYSITRSSEEYQKRGTCKRHSDAQVSKGEFDTQMSEYIN